MSDDARACRFQKEMSDNARACEFQKEMSDETRACISQDNVQNVRCDISGPGRAGKVFGLMTS